MIRTLGKSLSRLSLFMPQQRLPVAVASLSSASAQTVDPENMPYLHHGKRPRFRGYTKFKSPRKRASSLLHELTIEAVAKSKEARPKVLDTAFRVGDAIEIKLVAQGGVKSNNFEKIRGVVIGINRKGLDSSVLIRDVLFGEPVERRVPLHSPLLKSLKVLEENFVFKGKRKVKRAKLYYLRDRNPLSTFLYACTFCLLSPFAHQIVTVSRVTKW